MSQPRLSVVVPAVNRAHALPSFLQRFRAVAVDCEVVIVDDASTDGTAEVLRYLATCDSRIRCVPNSQSIGFAASRSRAMELARGETICCMGPDDGALPCNFERKLALLDANPRIGLVYSGAARTDDNGAVLDERPAAGLLSTSYIGGRPEFLDLLSGCYIDLASVVFRRSLLETYGGPDLRAESTAVQEWDMLLRWASHTDTAYFAEPMVRVGAWANATGKPGRSAADRIAVWRKWLAEPEQPLVLDDARWQTLREALLSDLRHETGSCPADCAEFIAELESLRRANACRISTRFENGQGRSKSWPPSAGSEITPIVWHAPLRDPGGYADEARSFLFALDGVGSPVSAREVRWSHRIAELTADRQRTLNRLQLAPPASGAVHVWHMLASHFQLDRSAAANVGRTMFETDRIPGGWADACNRMDAVWVPTEFNRATFAASGVDPDRLSVIPSAIDAAHFDPRIAPLRINGSRGYNFLSVFDWTLRKGWDVLIRAFVEEFDRNEDVALLLKTHSSLGFSLERILRTVESFITDSLGRDTGRIPDLVFQEATVPYAQIPALYRGADCCVMPTRGEGWGRPLMEAMAMGLPTIATAWSGQTEYMNEANSLPVAFELVEVPERGYREVPLYRGHRWGEPDLESLKRQMRRAFEDRAACREIGERARADITEQYSHARAAERIAEALERLG